MTEDVRVVPCPKCGVFLPIVQGDERHDCKGLPECWFGGTNNRVPLVAPAETKEGLAYIPATGDKGPMCECGHEVITLAEARVFFAISRKALRDRISSLAEAHRLWHEQVRQDVLSRL